MEVSDQINSVINNLAEKLGVAAEKLYPVLIKQAQVNAWMHLFWLIIGVLMIVAVPIFLYKVLKKDADGNYIAEYWEEFWVLPGFIIATALTAGFVLVGVNSGKALTAFINPDWYVIQMILEKISGK